MRIGNLKLLKSPGASIFLFILHFQSVQEGQPNFTKGGTLLKSLKSGGHMPSVPPIPTSKSLGVCLHDPLDLTTYYKQGREQDNFTTERLTMLIKDLTLNPLKPFDPLFPASPGCP